MNNEPEIKSLKRQSTSFGFLSSIFKPLYSWYIPTDLESAELSEKKLLLSGNVLPIYHPDTAGSKFNESDTHSQNVTLADSENPKLNAEIVNIEIGEDRYIRTLIIRTNRSEKDSSQNSDIAKDQSTETGSSENWLVICHGFGTGLGFYFKNYEELSKLPNTNICAIDWLGMGLSARPEFHVDKKLEIKELVSNTEEFFVESLEQWRIKMNIEKMILLGHSFGGYMSSLYALKYPSCIKKLILESPVGLQETPEYMDDFLATGDMTKLKEHPFAESSSDDIESENTSHKEESNDKSSDESKPESDVKENNSSDLKSVSSSISNQKTTASTNEEEQEIKPKKQIDFKKIQEDRSKAIRERIKSADSKPHYRFLVKTFIKLWNQKYSSPQSLVRYAGPYGRNMVTRYISKFQTLEDSERTLLASYMYHISAQPSSSERAISIILKPLAYARFPLIKRIDSLIVPTTFMYGDSDWMDYNAGKQLTELIKAPTHIYKLPNSGHNMHIDNPPAFNDVIYKILFTEDSESDLNP
ncbi:hypothetical protein BB560_002172 [Smittium megazygosporum]|uniref:AB hydrolase-1 domain-containing protein n=1 Tax=Smittium megazygosporum TaxID=133381 RepID=A0A2T9ZFL4_9FUNG|nr:hypothetical protein BB560_002172 [Smittium megazygosporum]